MVELIQGDSKQRLQGYNENTFDSCVTGAPYEYSFMGAGNSRITYAENNLGIVSEMILGNPPNQKMKKDQTINHDFW